ncbi:DUF2764 domain-containing protein [Bacteroidales bacterium OttesenSCG-928-B11]|nr:DUF2764 domain-containing protein [Bacteroidales bacterium OttesenSCG-928-C03]MDL2312973.1 DUF2764 domain-containing protein [Bacteroidales bacterium OttesenSCG-928-B11]MDL2325618.1 DUF2764 domain-containing protein [Bacteroidales bacterium OttesenSCG-928-A14]
MEYHAFIAGLPDLVFDEHKKVFTIKEYREELDDVLSKKDKKTIQNLMLKHDNYNLLSFLKNHEQFVDFDEMGIYSEENIATMVEDAKNEEWNKKYPDYFFKFLTDFFENDDQPTFYVEDHLAGLYYNYLCKTKNEFLREWSELNMNIRNILTMLSCKRNGMEYTHLIVGDNEVAQVLRTSSNPNHSLIELIDCFDDIRNIDDERDLLEKEQAIDNLLWNWIEENTFFHYFDIEKIMGYLFKLQIIERWRNLDKERGGEIFRKIVANLKKGINKLENIEN